MSVQARTDKHYLDADTPACWEWPEVDHPHHGWVSDDTALRLLHVFHDGHCAICDADEWYIASRSSSLYLDHGHDDGLVRGLLCRRCNALDGMPNPPLAVRLYRTIPPVDLLDIRVEYTTALARLRRRMVMARAPHERALCHPRPDLGLHHPLALNPSPTDLPFAEAFNRYPFLYDDLTVAERQKLALGWAELRRISRPQACV